jgi:outer membrane protein
MKKLNTICVALACMVAANFTALEAGSTTNPTNNVRVGIINFREAVEESKFGKKEQEQFEVMRKQMEGMLEDKEKKLADLAGKLNDADYVDSLSTETETQLKQEYRVLGQELAQLQNQYYQTLNQANVKIIQKLSGMIGNAAEKVARDHNLDIVLNEDSTFFFSRTLDLTSDVIKMLDDSMNNPESATTLKG